MAARAAAREQGDEDAVEGVGQAGFVRELVVAAGVDQLKDAVAELGGMGQIEDEAVLLGGDLLVEGRGVGAVEVEPDEFGAADRVVFVRAVAVDTKAENIWAAFKAVHDYNEKHFG